MRIGLPFLALAGLMGVASACLLDTTNDDDGAETGNGTGTSTAGTSTAGSDAGCTDASGTAAETAASTAADDTAGVTGVCGWGPTGDPAVPEGYVCGGDGEDPSGMLPLLCPEAVDLQVGAGCGGIEGTGCCDAQGNAWFCGNDGSGEALARLAC
jgi:hypothetical protein